MSSSIEWLARPGTKPETWNPVTGCTKVSAGCRNCYAETVAGRFWHKQYPLVLRDDTARTIDCVSTSHHKRMVADGEARPRRFSDVQCHKDRLALPLSWRTPRTCFVNSMSDLFHEAVPDEFIDRVFAVMALSPQHTFVVLTKRPERMRAYFSDPTKKWTEVVAREAEPLLPSRRMSAALTNFSVPLLNLWLGVSVEDQPTADQRIPLLLQTPAAVRVVSYEPALGPVDFLRIRGHGNHHDWLTGERDTVSNHEVGPPVDWVIVGGESGPKARPCDVAWIRSTVRQCRDAGVCVFCKQLGSLWASRHGGKGKGANMALWPADLRVREWPEVTP